MTKRGGRIIKHQKTRVIETGKNYSGEKSPYWDWVANHAESSGSSNEFMEPAQANPDRISSDNFTPFTQESGISVGDISRKLSGQQKKVFEMYVQEGKSEEDISKVLRLSVNTVRTYLRRIREKYKYYC